MSQERTLVLVKPDGVERGLVGEIIKRFENVGLKLEAIKIGTFPASYAHGHLPPTDEWRTQLGQKTLDYYAEHGLSAETDFGPDLTPLNVGSAISYRITKFLSSGPVAVMIWSGPHAVQIGRKILGSTMPLNAAPGTIRGDFGFDCPEDANTEQRGLRNIAHASDSPAEAEREIAHWFREQKPVWYGPNEMDAEEAHRGVQVSHPSRPGEGPF